MTIHNVNKDGTITPYKLTPVSKEYEIENFIEKNPEFLDKDFIVIGRQTVTLDAKKVDLMGLDKNGNVVILELKKDKAARKVISQILDYAVWAKDLTYEDLNSIYKKRKSSTDFSTLNEKFEKWTSDNDIKFNEYQKLYVIGEKIDSQTEKIANYLRGNGIDIYCIEINFHELNGNRICNRNDVVDETTTPVGHSMLPRTENDHLRHGEPIVHQLYNSLKQKVIELGPGITVNPVQSYIGFVRHGKVFLSVKIRKDSSMKLELQVNDGFDDPKKLTEQNSSRKELRYMHFKEKEKLEDIMHLVKQAYTTI